MLVLNAGQMFVSRIRWYVVKTVLPHGLEHRVCNRFDKPRRFHSLKLPLHKYTSHQTLVTIHISFPDQPSEHLCHSLFVQNSTCFGILYLMASLLACCFVTFLIVNDQLVRVTFCCIRLIGLVYDFLYFRLAYPVLPGCLCEVKLLFEDQTWSTVKDWLSVLLKVKEVLPLFDPTKSFAVVETSESVC